MSLFIQRIDYVHTRLTKNKGTSALAKWIEESVEPLKEIPR